MMRACTPKCYNAKDYPDDDFVICACVCDGLNHGTKLKYKNDVKGKKIFMTKEEKDGKLQ